jgi:DNA-binding HxlR family transcriptional regulator
MTTVKRSSSSSAIREMKKRISQAYGNLAGENYHSDAQEEWDVEEDGWIFNKSDPQLAGWQPAGYGVCGPLDATIVIESIQTKDSRLEPCDKIEVSYKIELPSGGIQREKASFVKPRTPKVHNLRALRAYIEAVVGEDITVFDEQVLQPVKDAIEKHGGVANMRDHEIRAVCDKVVDQRKAFPPIPEEYLESAVTPLCKHLREMETIAEILKPLDAEGVMLLRAIERRIDSIFSLALSIRQKELEGLHLADVVRGKAVASGGGRGGRALAERSRAHASAWKLNFAEWFQPLISRQSSGRGMSRDDAVDLARKEWPKEGFAGLPGLPRQMAFPSRQTMLNTLKDLEKDGLITRKSPPKGRHRVGS